MLQEMNEGVRAWDLMFAGQHDAAIRLMRDEYSGQFGDLSATFGLGRGYLWMGDYAAAWEHFDAVNRKQPRYSNSYYNMAGAAKWCMGEPRTAVEQWVEGCDCEYADAAGGADSPLLLFMASAFDPALITPKEAEKFLTIRADDQRVRYWLGPVVTYLLGRTDETTLRTKCTGVKPAGTVANNWLADFYVGVLQRANGSLADLTELMRRTAAVSPNDFTVGRRILGLKMLNAEYFIARHESAKAHGLGGTN
jgi:lipoprotein NlpI